MEDRSEAKAPNATRAPLARLRLGPLQRRLFLTVFVGLLPLAVLSSATLVYNARVQRQELLKAAENTMRAVGAAVDYETGESVAALDALGASASLRAGDLAAFRIEALELIDHRSEWANVILSDPSGRHLVNAVAPDDAALEAFESSSLEMAVRTGVAAIGDIRFDPLLGRHGFAVRVPVHEGGQIRYVLTAVMRPDAVQSLLTSQAVPAGGVVAVFDRRHRIVARSREQAKWLSKPASPGLLRLLESGRASGWGRATTLEGIEVYSVFQRSPTTGWSAAVGIPVEALDDPVMRSYVVLGGSVLLSALLGLLASFPVARTITTPMRELEAAATRVKAGESPTLPTTGLSEIDQALSALGDAHRERERLLQSERQARLLEQEARRLAETASREKDELLAMLGHEFRNPLAAIASSAELLAHLADGSGGPTSEAARIIRRQTRHLARMTEEALAASRATSGAIRLEREPTDLGAVVERAVDVLREAGRLREHALEVACQPVWVEGDAARLEQVVSNLLSNALKYTPAGGRIALALERQDAEAILRVRDTGYGIDPELLPRIFKPFVQGDRTLDRSQGGLGIGLTLVRRLVELHGGHVEAGSAGPGQGSEFVMRLPAIEPGVAASRSPALLAGARSRSIVVVEDNGDVRASLRHLLELGGHRVREADDGPTGVSLIIEEQPDLAIIDIGLPRLDGNAVAQAVREKLDGRIRLVALTGYGADEDVRRGLAVGFDDYLVKPIEPSVLGRLIERLDDADAGDAGAAAPRP